MGKYHPHGDAAIYDALARMAQDFSLRYPLIDGHGELRLARPRTTARRRRATPRRGSRRSRCSCSASIDEDTVDFADNYDGENERAGGAPGAVPEPARERRPAASRSAWPPTSRRTTSARSSTPTMHLIDHPDATPDDLMKFVQGPRLPDRRADPRPRRDRRRVHDRPRLDQDARGRRDRGGQARRPRIVVTEVPYQTSVEVIGAEDRRARERPRASRASATCATSRRAARPRLVDRAQDATPTRTSC